MRKVFGIYKVFFARCYSLHIRLCCIMMWISLCMPLIVTSCVELCFLAAGGFAISGIRLFSYKNGGLSALLRSKISVEKQEDITNNDSDVKYSNAVLNWSVVSYIVGWVIFLTIVIIQLILFLK